MAGRPAGRPKAARFDNNVIDSQLLAVRAVRAVVELGSNRLDGVWAPFFTPSRLPLLNQRWAVAAAGAEIEPTASDQAVPNGAQAGLRWGHTGGGYEYSLSFFDGFNHLPSFEPSFPAAAVPPGPPLVLDIIKRYPSLRMYGGDAAVPARWFTTKVEVACFSSSTPASDEYATGEAGGRMAVRWRVRGRGGDRAARGAELRAGSRNVAVSRRARFVHD
jgi:hypothetical protein